MSDFLTKREHALEACDKVINGIEDGTISVLSSLLLCKKIARLVNDSDGQEWLEYEYGGYPEDEKGFILHNAWEIAVKHGRLFHLKDKNNKQINRIFLELCGELESSIESNKIAINSFSTQGYSTSGEWAAAATNNMTYAVSKGVRALLDNIAIAQRRLSILKSQYYDYAAKWQIELLFGNTAKTVFEEYQERVDGYYSLLPTTTLQKLNAIEDYLESANPEHYAQVLTSCRRLWSETAKCLFSECFPDYSGKTFRTKSGQEIDISGDNDNNKLSAVIETLQPKASRNTLVGSEIIYLIDWIELISVCSLNKYS